MRGAEKIVESVAGKSPALISMGGQPKTNLLGETYFSQTPFLYGDYMAKFELAPVSPELTALTNAPLDVDGRRNALRETVSDFFRANDGEWELRVQLCTDIDSMPIEDAKVVWPEDRSPYVTVATVHVPPQQTWDEADAQRYEIAAPSVHGMVSPRTVRSARSIACVAPPMKWPSNFARAAIGATWPSRARCAIFRRKRLQTYQATPCVHETERSG